MNVYGSYANVRNAAWQVLIDYNISSVPVKVVEIAIKSKISIVKNSNVSELKSHETGASFFDGGDWYIVYDDTLSVGRSRFTVAHELGHIFLGHPLKFGYHARTIDTERPLSEKEADMFAARLLMPACVIWGLQLHTTDEISKIFGVSYEAAKARANRMETLYQRGKFLSSTLEQQVFNNFRDFIEKNKSI